MKEIKGLSLRTKFVILVIGAQVISLVVMLLMSDQYIRSEMEMEINRSGKQLVSALSMFDPAYLREVRGGSKSISARIKSFLDEIRTSSKKDQKEITKQVELIQTNVEGLKTRLGNQQDRLRNETNQTGEAATAMKEAMNQMETTLDRIQEQLRQLRENSRTGSLYFGRLEKRLEKLLSSLTDAREGLFLEPLREKYSIRYIAFRGINPDTGEWDPRALFAVPEAEIRWKDRKLLEKASQENIQVHKPLHLELRKNENWQTVGPSRMFEKIRRPGEAENALKVTLILDARQIQKAAGRMRWPLAGFALMTLFLGAMIGWFFSGKITSPIQSLVDDIKEVSEGNLSHRTVPKSKDEIGLLARTFDRMTRSLKQAREKEIEARELEHELELATDVQSNLLPDWKPTLDDWDLDVYYRPSKEVGGDYYDFWEIDDDHLGIIVADVSGKGVPGSMVMTMARAMFRMEAEDNVSTADTLKNTNRLLAEDIKQGMFITCMYLILNIPNKELRVSSAGHNPLVLWREKQQQVTTVNPNGIALGFEKGPVFDNAMEEKRFQLNKGDRFVLYTDGIVEAMNEEEEEFGENRFYKLVKLFSNVDSSQFTKNIVGKLDEFKGDAKQHDDITILTGRRTT